MAITECGKGHVYDTDQYAVCPYCNTTPSIINFGEDDAGEKTVAPGMFDRSDPVPARKGYMSNPEDEGKTVAPESYRRHLEDEGKTVAPESYRKHIEDEGKTVGVFMSEHKLEPVVGWLVCVEGAEKGRDYRLWARINSIGRGENMDVSIKKDDTISKVNHAKLAYDPKHNNFQLIPGESINNIYLNEEPVYTPVKLSAYDLIEIGNSKLLFVPLCGENFNWTDGVKQEA